MNANLFPVINKKSAVFKGLGIASSCQGLSHLWMSGSVNNVDSIGVQTFRVNATLFSLSTEH
jgi:hypothetical protein